MSDKLNETENLGKSMEMTSKHKATRQREGRLRSTDDIPEAWADIRRVKPKSPPLHSNISQQNAAAHQISKAGIINCCSVIHPIIYLRKHIF